MCTLELGRCVRNSTVSQYFTPSSILFQLYRYSDVMNGQETLEKGFWAHVQTAERADSASVVFNNERANKPSNRRDGTM